MPTIRRSTAYVLALLSLGAALPVQPAEAVQWQALASTSRHEVALDEASVRLTPLARLAVWLRFTPFGESQRRAAGAEYGVKGYRSHLEYYEIDCSEQSAVLGLIDIYGSGRSRLKRLVGGGRPEAIIPGSVLDRAARQVCPQLDSEAFDEDRDEPTPNGGGLNAAERNSKLTEEQRKQLAELQAAAERTPGSFEQWVRLGNAYFDVDLPDQAIAAYGRALALHPDDADVLNDQGAMYRQRGDFDKALANFEKAYRLDPNNLESLYNQGYLYAFDLNDIPTALALWKRYLQRDATSETAKQVQSFIERYSSQNK